MTLKSNTRKLAKLGKQVSDRLNRNARVYRFETNKAQVYSMCGFLPADDCRMLVRMIDQDAVPSTLYDASEDNEFRTSSSCNFSRHDPEIQRITQRISGLLGIDTGYGETIQGQRYQVGQQFKMHHDFFHERTSYWEREMSRSGQRTWTAMVYLNQPEGGGETHFPHLGFGVVPQAGTLLAWNNLSPEGKPNGYTAHIGAPVTAGTKYIITNWFRERPWADD
ncbi:prolyl hydroxylase family protein [Alterisphingorhabdus coralli]|uniref:2OG-Fe(II) oxygenase n=1 Tax=Alterisphingorhabdus coralli TaxID=3071408 RepID=A0AA97F5T2_9SPHN|nr:2OG-Fe(II) oxygenase [Parasphingorhabdus sp. SCSIO 66989]WOE74859.1 2OG-Fe(II) oxygenase [Parasphingorhabdus sp. SCSIO 66989]